MGLEQFMRERAARLKELNEIEQNKTHYSIADDGCAVVSDGETVIGARSFANDTGFTTVRIPDSVTSIGFEEQVLTFDISSFAFSKSDDQFFSGHYQMLNVVQLDSSVNSLEEQLESRYGEFGRNIMDKMRVYRYVRDHQGDSTSYFDVAQHIADTTPDVRSKIYDQANKLLQSAKADVGMYQAMIQSDKEYINRHYIELMRKFTLSVACLLLFLIGAPFGSIVRKGGLGFCRYRQNLSSGRKSGRSCQRDCRSS